MIKSTWNCLERPYISGPLVVLCDSEEEQKRLAILCSLAEFRKNAEGKAIIYFKEYTIKLNNFSDDKSEVLTMKQFQARLGLKTQELFVLLSSQPIGERTKCPRKMKRNRRSQVFSAAIKP